MLRTSKTLTTDLYSQASMSLDLGGCTRQYLHRATILIRHVTCLQRSSKTYNLFTLCQANVLRTTRPQTQRQDLMHRNDDSAMTDNTSTKTRKSRSCQYLSRAVTEFRPKTRVIHTISKHLSRSQEERKW